MAIKSARGGRSVLLKIVNDANVRNEPRTNKLLVRLVWPHKCLRTSITNHDRLRHDQLIISDDGDTKAPETCIDQPKEQPHLFANRCTALPQQISHQNWQV